MEKALRRMLVCLLTVSILIFMGCGSPTESENKTVHAGENSINSSENGDNMDETTEALEISFLNYYPGMGRDAACLLNNEFYSVYSPDDDSKTLYAFLVEIDHYYDGTSYFPTDYPDSDDKNYNLKRSQYDTAKAVELMEKAGLIVLPDYPYCFYNNDALLQSDLTDNNRPIIGLCAVVGTLDNVRRVFDKTEPLEGWYCYVWSAPRPDLVEQIEESGYIIDADTFCIYDGPSEFYQSILGEENQVTMRVNVKK